MWHPTLMKVLAGILLLAFGTPFVSLALLMPPGGMTGGCHGHPPMPTSSHSCCYARPEAPAQVQINPIAISGRLPIAKASPLKVECTNVAVMAYLQWDFSPPPESVLRI